MNTQSLDPAHTGLRLKRRPLRNLGEIRNGINISFEYFPAKNQFAGNHLRKASTILDRLNPKFVSVTYGAGGSLETECFRTLRLLKKTTSCPIAAHITNIAIDQQEVDSIAERIAMLGITRVVALRGDIRNAEAHPSDQFAYESTVKMIEGIRGIFDFDVSVAGYPETHPDAKSASADIAYLKQKVDAGAQRVLCQFCFDSDQFLRFRDNAVKAGINVPIIPGVLPIHDFEKVKRFANSCGASIPVAIESLFSELPASREIFNIVSATVTAEYCTRLIDNGVNDFHFYTLNRANLVRSICHILGIKESQNLPQLHQSKRASIYQF